MSKKASKTTQPEPEKPADGRVSLRLESPLAERFEKVVEASRRSKTSIIEECLEEFLPRLERQHLKKAA